MTDDSPAEHTTSYPRLAARTGRFTLGVPRSLTPTGDGRRVLFVRTASGTDRSGKLWSYELGSGQERLLLDPAAALGEGGEQLSAAERARRERAREQGAGVVGYALDRDGTVAALALSSRRWVVQVESGEVRDLGVAGPVVDPRPDPTGRHVAYAAAGELRVVGVDGADDRAIGERESETVSWGVAEFVAAEEMERYRGFWWAPDGGSLLAARVDEAAVPVWYIADPEHPDRAPAAVRYPAAGATNAEVRLYVLGLDGGRTEVEWDRAAFEYLITAGWDDHGPWLRVMSRDQRRSQLLAVDPSTGATSLLSEATDDVWLDVVTGVPARTDDGRLVDTADLDDTRRLTVDGTAVSPAGLQVAAVLDVDDETALVRATDEPTEQHLYEIALDGSGARRLTTDAGVHAGGRAGGVTVVASSVLGRPRTRVEVRAPGAEPVELPSYQQEPPFSPGVTLLTVGERDLRAAVLYPRDHTTGTRLPVLVDPYGGPHHQEVVKAHGIWLEPQWFADQGFAVVVADGRGTGSRGQAWDRAVHHDLAEVTLTDQVDALHAVAKEHPDLDLDRVGIRGWSYGGYLSALAVLRRPDVFHAAIAGAPVTDLALYDTFYTERYLGLPQEQPEVYSRNSIVADAARLSRPLMVIHGLADDNVVAAHSLQLSSALLAAGRPHEFLPLSGVTHMASQEAVAENLLLLQVDFLRRHLGG